MCGLLRLCGQRSKNGKARDFTFDTCRGLLAIDWFLNPDNLRRYKGFLYNV
jgi:hypothetical protein